MIFIKYFLYILFIYLVLFIGTLSFIFSPIKNDIIQNSKKLNHMHITNFELKAKKQILDNKYEDLLENMLKLKETGIIDDIKISYLKHFITVNSLLSNSDNIKTKDWVLNDISVDSRYGTIKKYTDVLYIFKAEEDYEFTEYIDIKFQALNDQNMQNSISSIIFELPTLEFIKEDTKDLNIIQEYLKSSLNLQNTIIEKDFTINISDKFANIVYVVNHHHTFDKIYNTLVNIFYYFTILYFLIVLIIIGFNYVLLQLLIIRYLKALEKYASDVLENKFYKFNEENLKSAHIIAIAKVISKISKKTSSIINELNVNKSTLELRISTDTLTKLPNTKIFENDLKSLFLTDIPSYISLVKLEVLKDFAKNNSQDLTDSLIVNFSDILKSTMKKLQSKNGKIYRLYGSEFVIISKYTDYELIEKILTKLTSSMNTLQSKFNIDRRIVYAVSIPFDHYSTTARILENLETKYSENESLDDLYFAEKPDEINQKDLELEKVVTSIIKNDAFSLSYKFDTFLFNDEDVLVMKEVAANLISTDGSTIPIGTFIAVAEHKNIAVDFDKQLILKVFKFIKKNNITYDLAINISISSINDVSFINWLEAKILYDYKNAMNNVVFSVTTFAAKNNFDTFIKFSNDVKKFGGRILLKRFSYNDLKLEQLESLHLDFIRVHKDYTTNINPERKVVLKNIVNFSIIHDIHVLGDLVSNETDYNTLKGLKFYATSK